MSNLKEKLIWIFTLDETDLRRLALEFCVNPTGTLPIIRDRIVRFIHKREGQPNIPWDRCDSYYPDLMRDDRSLSDIIQMDNLSSTLHQATYISYCGNTTPITTTTTYTTNSTTITTNTQSLPITVTSASNSRNEDQNYCSIENNRHSTFKQAYQTSYHNVQPHMSQAYDNGLLNIQRNGPNSTLRHEYPVQHNNIPPPINSQNTNNCFNRTIIF